jgi:hypothetical protein
MAALHWQAEPNPPLELDKKQRSRRPKDGAAAAMGQFCDLVQIAISDIFFTFLDRSVNDHTKLGI